MFPQVHEIGNAFEGTGQFVVKEKKSVAAESLPRRLREIVNVVFNSMMKYIIKSREPKTYHCSSL